MQTNKQYHSIIINIIKIHTKTDTIHKQSNKKQNNKIDIIQKAFGTGL